MLWLRGIDTFSSGGNDLKLDFDSFWKEFYSKRKQNAPKREKRLILLEQNPFERETGVQQSTP